MQLTYDTIIWLATAALYSLALYNCYHILGARRSPAASISWIWANLTLPIIGVPLYWFFGPPTVRDYKGYGDVPLAYMKAGEGPEVRKKAEAEHLASFRQIFAAFGSVFTPLAGEVGLLVDGVSTFDAIFKAINQSQHYILVQYYILRSDRLGLELKELLIAKARQGVKVFLLYDDMGSFWLSRRYIKDLRRAGVRIATFLPVMSSKRFFLLNYRNHRKLVAVDGLMAFTGGLNVGEEYVGSRFGKKKRWRDTHIRIAGRPTVSQLEAIFMGDWQYATGSSIADDIAQCQKQAEGADAAELLQPQRRFDSGSAPMVPQIIQILPTSPFDEASIGMLLFIHMIHSAHTRLWVSTPYFVPDDPLQKGLELAVLRGVDVRVLVPLQAEEKVVHWVTLSYAEQLQRKGIKVYLYQKGFNHQKVFLVDDDLSFVGTSNFDNRTLYLNFETLVAIHGTEFNQEVEAMLENDFNEASLFQPYADRFIRKLIRLRANSARLLAPLL